MDPEQIARALAALSPEQRAQAVNRMLSGLDKALGIEFTYVSPERVMAECEVRDVHLQPYGLVHGGVYASLAESVCSLGAAMTVISDGKNVVGRSNQSRFLKAARQGSRLHITAMPAATERRNMQRWVATMGDGGDVIFAESEVMLVVLESHREVAGGRLHVAGLEESLD